MKVRVELETPAVLAFEVEIPDDTPLDGNAIHQAVYSVNPLVSWTPSEGLEEIDETARETMAIFTYGPDDEVEVEPIWEKQ